MELKRGIATFEALGFFESNGKTKVNQSNSPKWKYSNMFFKLKCGSEDFGTSLIGGFNPSAPRDIEYSEFGGKLHPVVEKNGKPTVDWKGSCKVVWDKRFDTNELEKIANMDKIKVELTKGDRKEFLTNYDLINYLSENLVDEQSLKVYGNIIYNYKDGKLEENYAITQIYGAQISEEYPAYCSYKQTLLVNSESIQPTVDNIILVKSFAPTYINKNGNDYINSIIAVPFEFNIDTKLTPKYQIYLDKFFKTEPKKFSEIVVEYGVKKYGDVKEITLEDIMSTENKDTIETDLLLGMSEEEVLAKYVGVSRKVIASGDMKFLKVFKDICRSSESVDGKIIVKHQFVANKYKESEVFFAEDFAGKKKETTKKVESKPVEKDEPNFDDLFADMN